VPQTPGGGRDLSIFSEPRQALINSKWFYVRDAGTKPDCLGVDDNIEFLRDYHGGNDVYRYKWLAGSGQCFFRRCSPGWNSIGYVDRHQHVITRNVSEFHVDKGFYQCERHVLSGIDDRRTLTIAAAGGVKTTTAREIGVRLSCEPVDRQLTIPWSIRTSSSSTPEGSCVRTWRGLRLLKMRLGLFNQAPAFIRDPKVSTACAKTLAYSSMDGRRFANPSISC